MGFPSWPLQFSMKSRNPACWPFAPQPPSQPCSPWGLGWRLSLSAAGPSPAWLKACQEGHANVTPKGEFIKGLSQIKGPDALIWLRVLPKKHQGTGDVTGSVALWVRRGFFSQRGWNTCSGGSPPPRSALLVSLCFFSFLFFRFLLFLFGASGSFDGHLAVKRLPRVKRSAIGVPIWQTPKPPRSVSRGVLKFHRYPSHGSHHYHPPFTFGNAQVVWFGS